MALPIPPEGVITHEAFSVAADGSDVDALPDVSTISGLSVILTPSVKSYQWINGGVSRTYQPDALTAAYDLTTGRLGRILTDGTISPDPLVVPATEGTGIAPSWQYTVKFVKALEPKGADNEYFGRTNPITVPIDGTVDLGNALLNAATGKPAALFADLLGAAADLSDAVEEIRNGDLVTATSVRRIVAAQEGTNPDLTDGDLVVYYSLAGANYYDDFLTHPVGTAPTGWSQPWAQTDTWKVQNVAGALGGKALVVSPAAASWHALTLDLTATDPERADVEVLMRQKATNGGYLGAAILHATGTTATTTKGWRLGPTNDTSLRIGDLTNGTFGARASGVISPAAVAEAWYFIRARIEGNVKYVKFWRDGVPEPEAWSLQTTSAPTPVPPVGPSGIVMTNYLQAPLTVTIDWVAIATGGRTARPM